MVSVCCCWLHILELSSGQIKCRAYDPHSPYLSLALVGQPFVLGECLIKIRNTRGIMALIKDRAKWSPLAKSGCLPIKSTSTTQLTLDLCIRRAIFTHSINTLFTQIHS